MHALKTGSYTSRGPLLLRAALAAGFKRVVAALTRYAGPLGVAFQLRDDLLGAFASEAETGKRRGQRSARGKRTALLAEAQKRLDPEGRAAIDRALGRARRPRTRRCARPRSRWSGAARAPPSRSGSGRSAAREAGELATKLPVSDRARTLAGAALALLPR